MYSQHTDPEGPIGYQPVEFLDVSRMRPELDEPPSPHLSRTQSLFGLGTTMDAPRIVDEWGPLSALAGEWEGAVGFDTAYSHSQHEVILTPYREKATFRPFGPVDNGRQRLYGLDYRTAMFRNDDTSPFHAEVGYWMWDAAAGEVLRAFVVPRGVSVLAGGNAAPDATEFTLAADLGGAQYTIGENQYLAKQASSHGYRLTVTINPDDSWSYSEVTMLKLNGMPEPFAHADQNTLHRVG